MTSAPYLDNFLGSLEYLPSELERKLKLLGLLDEKLQTKLALADQYSNQLLTSMASSSTAPTEKDRAERIQKIKSFYKAANDLAEDKLQVADQCYDMVDRFIRRLDAGISNFKSDIATMLEELNLPISEGLRDYGVGVYAENYLEITHENVNSIVNRKIDKSELTVDECAVKLEAASLDDGPVEPVKQNPLDMVIDKHEPVFCFCKQVSYGLMVCCDNPDCAIEWFHFECVGLTAKPKHEWYCIKCLPIKKRTK